MLTSTSLRNVLRVWIWLSLFFFIHGVGLGQTSNKVQPDSAEIELLLDQAYTLEIELPDSALAIYEAVIELALSIPYKLAYARGHLYSGIVYSDQGNYKLAIPYFEDAIRIFEEENHLSISEILKRGKLNTAKLLTII